MIYICTVSYVFGNLYGKIYVSTQKNNNNNKKKKKKK